MKIILKRPLWFTTITTLCFIAVTLFAATGCDKSKKEDDEPIEIPFTEYSLFNTGCWWTYVNNPNEIIIINNKEELEEYITCGDTNYPVVDFSKHTLLHACGGTSNGISNISKKLQRLSTNEYILNVEITLDAAMVAQGWGFVLITSKLSETSSIKLNTTIIK